MVISVDLVPHQGLRGKKNEIFHREDAGKKHSLEVKWRNYFCQIHNESGTVCAIFGGHGALAAAARSSNMYSGQTFLR